MCYQKSQKKSEFSELQLRYHVQATHTIRSCSVRNHMVLNAEGASSLLNSKSNAWVWTPRRQFLPLTLLRCWCFKIDTFFETIYVFFWQGSGGPIVFGISSSDAFAGGASGEILFRTIQAKRRREINSPSFLVGIFTSKTDFLHFGAQFWLWKHWVIKKNVTASYIMTLFMTLECQIGPFHRFF